MSERMRMWGAMPASERNGIADAARLFGAVGIVWFHAKGPGGVIGHAALQMFMAMTILYMPSGDRGLPLVAVARARFRRLMVPWLIWSAIFAAAKIADGLLSGGDVAAEFAPWMLLAGPSLHLWFLPFAFAVGLALLALWRAVAAWRGIFPLGLVMLAVLQATCLEVQETAPPPLREWLHVAPAAFLGLMPHVAGRRAARLAALLGVQAALLAARFATDLPLGGEQALLGAGFAVAAVALHAPSTPTTRMLGGLALGVYLCHPLFAAGLARVMEPASGAVFAIAVVVCAVAFAALMEVAPLRPLTARLRARRKASPAASIRRPSRPAGDL